MEYTCEYCIYYRPNALGVGMLCDKKREFYMENPWEKLVCEDAEYKPIEIKYRPKESE